VVEHKYSRKRQAERIARVAISRRNYRLPNAIDAARVSLINLARDEKVRASYQDHKPNCYRRDSKCCFHDLFLQGVVFRLIVVFTRAVGAIIGVESHKSPMIPSQNL
jgi:hypothetical protein